MRTAMLTGLLLAALSFTGCAAKTGATTPATPASALTNLSKAIDDISKAVGTTQTAVITANQAGYITDDQTGTLLSVFQKINAGGSQVVTTTRSYTTLTVANKAQLLAAFNPIVAAVQQSLDSGLLGIKNANTKQDVQTALTLLKTLLGSVTAILNVTSSQNTGGLQWAAS